MEYMDLDNISFKRNVSKNLPDEMEVDKYLSDNQVWVGDVYTDKVDLLYVEIEGDWKHDHLRADYLIREKYHPIDSFEQVTDEDGSDYYTAIHCYRF